MAPAAFRRDPDPSVRQQFNIRASVLAAPGRQDPWSEQSTRASGALFAMLLTRNLPTRMPVPTGLPKLPSSPLVVAQLSTYHKSQVVLQTASKSRGMAPLAWLTILRLCLSQSRFLAFWRLLSPEKESRLLQYKLCSDEIYIKVFPLLCRGRRPLPLIPIPGNVSDS